MSSITSGPSIPVYCASKRAVLSVADSLRRQIARDGLPIGVSVLLPATVSTNFAEGSYGESGPDDGVPGSSAPIEPSVVADQVVAAIDEGRFYIFTHADSQMLSMDGIPRSSKRTKRSVRGPLSSPAHPVLHGLRQ